MSAVRGWCPSAHRPMVSGDGLLVRIQPKFARFSVDQMRAICDLSDRFGNGLMDLTSRGNLQLRGCREAAHADLLHALIDLGVVAHDPRAERLCTVTPEAAPGSVSHMIASQIYDRMSELPDLPTKMGVVVDAENTRRLADTPGDFRFEQGEDGLMLRADGVEKGWPVKEDEASVALIEMARWFVETGGAEARRMRHHVKTVDLPKAWQIGCPAPANDRTVPNLSAGSVGFPYGRATTKVMREICSFPDVCELVFTPWRMIILKSEQSDISVQAADISIANADISELVTDISDPRWKMDVCPGSAGCASSKIDTYLLAAELAGESVRHIHISGCAKGCAHPQKTDVTIVGTEGGLDLVLQGCAGDTPNAAGLDRFQLVRQLRGMT